MEGAIRYFRHATHYSVSCYHNHMRFVIAIDGASGMGKTTLANELGTKLNIPILHFDDFGDDYKPFVGLPRLFETLASSPDPLIIIEGVGVMDERLEAYDNFKILLETSTEERTRRYVTRDAVKFDEAQMNIINKIWGEERLLNPAVLSFASRTRSSRVK